MGEVAIPEYDLLIAGGGINGCGIARDAAGRGLKVLLCEQLYAREVDYQIKHEWAHTPEDVVWRRTKTGLHLNTQQKQQLADYLHAQGVTPVR